MTDGAQHPEIKAVTAYSYKGHIYADFESAEGVFQNDRRAGLVKAITSGDGATPSQNVARNMQRLGKVDPRLYLELVEFFSDTPVEDDA